MRPIIKQIALALCALLLNSPALHAAPLVYVANGANTGGGPGSFDTVYVIQTATNNVTATVNIGATTCYNAIAGTPDGKTVLVGAFDGVNGIVARIDVATSTHLLPDITLTNSPESLAILPNGLYAYVTCDDGTVNRINLTTNAVDAVISGFIAPYEITTAPDSLTVYVNDFALGAEIVVPIKVSDNSLGTSVSAPKAFWMAVSLDNKYLYVSNIKPNDGQHGVQQYDLTDPLAPVTATYINLAAAISSKFPGLALTADSKTLYVTDYPNSAVIPIDLSNPLSPVVQAAVSVGTNPWIIAITPDGNSAYVSDNGTSSPGTVTELNIINRLAPTVIATIDIGNNPAGLTIIKNQSGNIDTSFGTAGFTIIPISRADSLQDAVIQTGDKIIIAGTTQTTAPSSFLSQYTSSGFLDKASFNSSGPTPGYQTLLVGTESQTNGVALDASNNIYVAGFCIQTQTKMLLARYTPAGVLDTTFNPATGYITELFGSGATANDLAMQGSAYSDRIILGGCSIQNGTPCFTLAGFTTAGALDATFGTSGSTTTVIGEISFIRALAIIPEPYTNEDDIIAVGQSDNQLTIARYTSVGVLDTSFGSSGIFIPSISGASSSTAYNVALDPSNNIVIAGSAKISGIEQSLLMRCTPGGALDTTFNGTGYVLQSILDGSEFYSLALQSNNYIVTGGYAVAPLYNQISLARYSTTGAFDPNWNNNNGVSLTTIGVVAAANAVTIQSTGEIIAAGTADGTFYVMRVFGS